ncbi:MAG: GntP family permease [Gammaproteobacteria bacterium]
MLANLGLLLSLALLIWLVLRGVNVILASLLAAIVVALSNGLPLTESLLQHYATGRSGAFTFAGQFFLIFIAGAIFGKVMAEGRATTTIALMFRDLLGRERVLWIIMLACALLTYGGVVVFVVIFAVYPLALELARDANTPKRLLAGAAALGAGTFTMTAMPGTPSIHNVIAARSLGTDLFAAPVLGLVASALMMVLGMAYLERERRAALARGEDFDPAPSEHVPDDEELEAELPGRAVSLLPLLVVLGIIIGPRLLAVFVAGDGDSSLARVIGFAASQPVFWPSLALAVGTVLALVLLPRLRGQGLASLGRGTNDAILPIMNTAAIIGFGGVVIQTSGFAAFSNLVVDSGLPPLLSAFLSISTVAAITGSASGGLQIFMASLAPRYLEMGIEPEVLHRISTLASGGFDSLPHCGAVVVMMTIMGLSYRKAYRDIAVVTIVVPVVTTLVVMGLAALTA